MTEMCWCGKVIHYCDDGMPDGRVACECSVGRDHTTIECLFCHGDENEEHEPKTRP